MLGILGFLILVFLPGAWISFGFPLFELSFSSRLILGAVLAPLVVCFQFYIFRLLGAPFEPTVILLIVINIFALFLIIGQIIRKSLIVSFPDRSVVFRWVLALIVPIALLIPTITHPLTRMFTGHAWLYTDPIYQLANGNLLLEDSELAGVRFAYPWAGLVYQGILSFLLGSPPASSYIWTNVLWILFIYFFIANIVGELGGNLFSRLASVIWLSFGVNFVGFLVEKIALAGWAPLMNSGSNLSTPWPILITGDFRYTPWLWKFLFFEQEPLALGIFIALLFLLVKHWSGGLSRYPMITIGLLLVAEGLIYSPLFPSAAALVGAKLITMIFNSSMTFQKGSIRKALPLALILLFSSVVTLGYANFLTQDRVTSAVSFIGPLKLSTVKPLITRTITCTVVTFPLLVGLVFTFRKTWQNRYDAVIVLVLGAMASFLCYIIFYLPGFNNEYKYIFTPAICLTPFPSLAVEPLKDRLGRNALPVFGALTLVLAFPFAYKLINEYPWSPTDFATKSPSVNIQNFDLRLADIEKFSGLSNAILQKTPTNTILVIDNAALNFPTLTHRSLYAPPNQEKPYPGVNIPIEDILEISRGYSTQTIQDRKRIVETLFVANNGSQIAQSLMSILDLNRPFAIIIEDHRNTMLLDWLTNKEIGRSIYQGDGYSVWLITPESYILEGIKRQVDSGISF